MIEILSGWCPNCGARMDKEDAEGMLFTADGVHAKHLVLMESKVEYEKIW